MKNNIATDAIFRRLGQKKYTIGIVKSEIFQLHIIFVLTASKHGISVFIRTRATFSISSSYNNSLQTGKDS